MFPGQSGLVTSPRRPAGAGPPDQPADGAADGPGNLGHELDGRVAVPAEAVQTTDSDDPVAVSVADFAAQLRELRERAGRPSYRQLARLAHYSHTALSQAAAGSSLPSLAVAQAFVRACGGDVEEWTARWRQVKQVARPPRPPVPGPARPGSARLPTAGWFRARARIAAAAMTAAAACTAAVALWHADPAATASLPGQAVPRLGVESSGLYVRYAVVTNLGTRAGYAYILNTGAGKVHRSPRPVRPGQSWTYFFGRDLKDGAQICGSIDLGPATCAAIRASGSDPHPNSQRR